MSYTAKVCVIAVHKVSVPAAARFDIFLHEAGWIPSDDLLHIVIIIITG